jgi:hypothetical protein
MQEKSYEGPTYPDFRLVKGMDPAANWLLDPARVDFLPDSEGGVIPLLLELDAAAVDAFKRLVEARGEGVEVLGFGPENDRIKPNTPLPVMVTREWLFGLLDGSDEVRAFLDAQKRIVLSSPLEPPQDPRKGKLPARLDKPTPALERYSPKSKDSGVVIVAAIDDGFGFAHERFLGDGTRIEVFWDMNRGYPYPTPVEGELSKTEIDDLVRDATIAGHVDEDLVYSRAGLLNFAEPRHKPLAWRDSHGTHVLDLAGGSAPGQGGPPLIAVQLPTPAVARTTGELLDFYVWLGVLYACYIAETRPLAINVSFGYNAGAHDGEGMLDRALSRLVVERPRTAVILPAGNAQLDRCHSEIDLAANSEVTFDWIVQPSDRTHSIVEIWLPEESPGERISVTLALPDGAEITMSEPPAFVPADQLPAERLYSAGQAMGLLELWERPDGRRMFRLAIAPTARPEPDPRPLAPAGSWTLTFRRGDKPMRAAADVWVQRDDSLYSYPQRGRQSYLDHPGYARFDGFGYPGDDDPSPGASPVTRRSTMNAIATSENVLVAGGYRVSDSRIARYSSGGPNTPPEPDGRLKPDVLLPSDDSVAHSGILAAGSRCGVRTALDGSSVAVPQVTRRVARELAVRNLTRDDFAAIAAAEDIGRDQGPPHRGGHGRLPRQDSDPPLPRVEPG